MMVKEDNMECLTCQRDYTQGGRCCARKKNCIHYVNESRGRRLRITLQFKMTDNAESYLIKRGEKIIIEEKTGYTEITVADIQWIDMRTGICSIEAECYENELPLCEKKKRFKIVKG